jgi:signal transduction histidine kinase
MAESQRTGSAARLVATVNAPSTAGAPSSNLPAQLAVAGASTWLLLVAAVVVPRHVVGHPSLPASGAALTGLSIAVGYGAVRLRPNPTKRTLNRALVHGVLTVLVIAAYAITVSGLAVLLHKNAGAEVALGAAGLVALAVQPLRSLVQRRVNSMMFGDRDDPYRAITKLGRSLETTALPEEVLPSVVETVAGALRLPYVAIELESQTGPVVAASTGALIGDTVRLQLTHHARGVGWLVLGTRARSERLGAADLRLLEDLARQIGVAARAVQLMHDLQRSHALVVLARDQERCRLQRNLHDGLGPMLAGIGLAAQAARNLAQCDPTAADALLARVVADSRAATADVRRLVYDQRPLELDRLGLVEALREQVARLRTPGEGASNENLVVEIDASPDLHDLPAAVEVAAFRIALEAFVNVWRHANARSCTIRLAIDQALHIDVIDDGDGLAADARPGVGMASMQERAGGIGGVCTVTRPERGGTRVHAELPIPSLRPA